MPSPLYHIVCITVKLRPSYITNPSQHLFANEGKEELEAYRAHKQVYITFKLSLSLGLSFLACKGIEIMSFTCDPF